MPTRNQHDLMSHLVAFLLVGILAGIWPQSASTQPVEPVAIIAAPPAAPAAPPATVLTDVADVAPAARTVALTFDDGPHPRWTPQVLDLLARYRAVATFCLVGEQAVHHTDLVRRIAEAGMRLCNHSHSHDEKLATEADDVMQREMIDTQTELETAAASPVTYFRAPGGRWSNTMMQVAAGHGMRPLGWSVDARDWKQPGTAEIVRRVKEQMHPGAVVLLHDGGGRRGQTVAALEQLLPWLVRNCYVFAFPSH
jgi:peptidoglycan/xylan/chitin deacetylase (PgdA/CDA1 family)